ncbi:MAG: acyloxyacyl hydrolase [Phycisphaerales bacterium]|nr:acyloxyacyl hydrolase [Phycisphaerales bacterium]
MRQAPFAAAFTLLLATPALAERESLSLSLAEQRLNDPPAQAGGEANEQPDADLSLNTVSHRFGEAGTWWWGVGAMGTLSDDATDARLDVAVRTFLADNFELNLSLSGWAFFQDGTDAQAINPGFAFRWHFINNHERGYSVYAETGIGLLFANDEVPDTGTRFNFTPHAGVGATFALGDAGERLDLGVGWHHISNASTSGTDDNPARDSIAIWLGVIFPF